MRIPLFAHDANPASDASLCYKSRSAIIRLLSEGQVRILVDKKGREWGAQFLSLVPGEASSFADKLAFAVQNAALSCGIDPALHGVDLPLPADASKSATSDAAITSAESEANVGIAERPNEIIRAREKLLFYPLLHDSRAVTAYGRWA